MKKMLKFLVPIIIVVAIGFSFYLFKKKQNKSEWKTQDAEIGMIRDIVTSTGTINPIVSVNVGTEVSGTIEKLYKDYNATVKKGELLAKLNTENLELSLEDAKAEKVKAEETENDKLLDLNNLKELVKKNMAAAYDLQKAQYNYEQARQNVLKSQNALKRAQTNLDNATILSPIDGVIISRNVDEGQTVAASFNAPTLFVIANNLQQMQINASVDEADIGKIKLGLPVRFRVDAFTEENFKGVVKQIRLSPTSEQNVVSYTVVIEFSNPDMLLLPGMTANVEIIANAKQDVLIIPEKAIQFRPSEEIWKSFGLVWNDSLMQRKSPRGNRGSFAMGSSEGSPKTVDPSKKTSGQTINTNQTNSDKKLNKKDDNNPGKRMSREDFDKLTPEQKQKFIEKIKNRRKRDEQEHSNELIQTPTVDVFQLRDKAEYYTRKQTNSATVWVLENNKPVLKTIETGLSSGNKIEVISGLKSGDKVIVGVLSNDSNSNNQTTSSPFGGAMQPNFRR